MSRFLQASPAIIAAMALLASLQSIVDVHFGVGIIDREYAVAAVAVVALRCVAVTKRIYLAMEGLRIGFQIVFMATAAGMNNAELERLYRCIGNAVRSVAVGAYRRLWTVFLQHLPAVHRGGVLFQLIGMTFFAAGFWNGQMPCTAVFAALGRHIKSVGVVTVVATCIDPCGVVSVLTRVECILVCLDVVYDDTQSCFFFGLVFFPGGFPQIGMALHTAYGLGFAFLMRLAAVFNALMASYALHSGVHALAVRELFDRPHGS